jgi:hypothetical protein
MTAIPSDFGEGGKNLAPGGSAGEPTLAQTLQDVADDLAAVVEAVELAANTVGAALSAPVAVTVGTDIAAFTDPPSAAEMATLRTFVNALKADHGTLRSEVATAVQRINQIRTDLLDVRAKVTAAADVELLTTKAD